MNVEHPELYKYLEVWQSPEYRIKCHGLRIYEQRPDLFRECLSLLDAGCGLGKLVTQAAADGIDAHGVDFALSESLTAVAKEMPSGQFTRADLESLDLGRAFDVVVCADVLEHIRPEWVTLVLERLKAHCAPEGRG